MEIKIGNRLVGDDHPVFIIAEIGINHNGDIEIVKKLAAIALDAGCDAIKFQKRTPHICVPPEQMGKMRDTPWGRMNYLQYRYKVEFGEKEYDEIAKYCSDIGIMWFASCWDVPSIDFFDRYDIPCYKLPSPCFTSTEIIQGMVSKGKPIIASCGMSLEEDIDSYLRLVPKDRQVLMYTNSTYPCPVENLNMKAITALRNRYKCLVGYSGHEAGLFTTPLSVSLGVCAIERHITLDRSMWGTDQGASVEPKGLYKLVEEIRTAEIAMGDGIKRMSQGEQEVLRKLRRKTYRRPKGRIGCIVQARMGSTRLPEKVLAKLAGKPLVERIVDRLALCRRLDDIIVAIPDSKSDDVLEEVLRRTPAKIYRGDEHDVMMRYLDAAREYRLNYIVRLPADNPCVSPLEVDKIVEYYMVSAFDFCTNLYEVQGNGYPDGIGAEIFAFDVLADVSNKVRTSEYREHIHRYFFDKLNIGTIMCPIEYAYPSLKLDVNTPEDLAYIQRIYNDLSGHSGNTIFDIKEIVEWHKKNQPEKIQKPSLSEYKALNKKNNITANNSQ